MSRHRSLVATSLYAFAGFNWSLMMSRHQSLVATSAQVFCSLQLVVHDVATSISCRDISLCLCSLHWLFLVSRLQSSVATQLELHQLHLSKPVIASRRFSCRDLHPLSQHQPLSRHHDAVATSRCCRDIIPLVSA